MLSIIAFIGGAVVGGVLAIMSAANELEKRATAEREQRTIAENALAELNLIKSKRSQASYKGNQTRAARRRAADPVVLEMGRKAGRPEESRVGKGCVSTGKSRWSRCRKKKQ